MALQISDLGTTHKKHNPKIKQLYEPCPDCSWVQFILFAIKRIKFINIINFSRLHHSKRVKAQIKMFICCKQYFHVPNWSPKYFENPPYFVDGGGKFALISVSRINPAVELCLYKVTSLE